MNHCVEYLFLYFNALKNELENIETNGIIVKEHEPTEWVHSLVLINKRDSGLKVVLDPCNLHKYLQRTFCQMPTIDEVSSKFAECNFFLTLDK